MSTITLYHYTNEKGAAAIIKSGYLKASNLTTDATFGKGVYFTSMSPVESKLAIARNNWDGKVKSLASKMVKAGRLDYYIAVTFKERDRKLKQASCNRDVYVYKEDLILDHFNYVINEFDEFFDAESFVEAVGIIALYLHTLVED
ncbi:uncharacterized protein LOC130649169 [Hydractinia symbiolongicarpus]|uniref:uncharacterized protein LOC130649169 n=1 Tax=Hydractinia symbiolongicarpus TaxID=13093 RepID=UPI0025515F4C|nr:uncharacterized protein LOC130649169 [Hydractinia symbiolongicarpus]